MSLAPTATERPLDEQLLKDMAFEPSPEVSLGVELELQILDRETGELAPGALRILGGCEEDHLEGVSGEFLLSMLEVRTGVCRNVAEVGESLFPLLRRVRNIARSVGYDLAIGGTHPFGRASMSAVFPDERYQRIQNRQGWMACQEPVFGLHIHVGVPSGDAAIGVTNLLVEYLPHLLSLSANSPLWQGTDTSYASARGRMFRPAAMVGIPPHLKSWEDFRRFCEVMHEGGLIQTTKDLYWDIRPRPHFGTIEFRIFDAPTTLSCLLGLAALTRCLVIEALAMLEKDPELSQGDPYRFWLAKENRWMATRYGLKALCMRRPNGERRTLLDDTAELLERLGPVAAEAGESNFLQSLQPLELLETGSERQRRIYRDTGTWKSVVDDMKARWVNELQERLIAKPSNSAAAPAPEPKLPTGRSAGSNGHKRVPAKAKIAGK